MKKIHFIICLALFYSFCSCSKSSEDTEIPKSTENGYTFNAEFFPTNALILSGLTPGSAAFFIPVDNTGFNGMTGEFAGNAGRGIFIFIGIDEDISGLKDIVGIFTNVKTVDFDYMDGDFAGGLFKDIGSLESLFDSDTNSNKIIFANTGEVRVSFESETEKFTLEYTLTTNQGTITGYYKGLTQQYLLKGG